MFHFIVLLVSCSLIAPVFSYSAGAPVDVCGDLKPQHGLDGQTSLPPYTLSGADTVKSGESISITLEGHDFKGFVVQARDTKGTPIGEFKIIDSNKSQILSCGGPNTITHKKLNTPIQRVEFRYIAPHDYHGKVKFVATVAENGAVFWVQKLIKEIQVQ